jgi:hypothetical protein
MIELATQKIAHHQAEAQKWEKNLARFKETKTEHQTQIKSQNLKISSLEMELQKSRTTGPVATAEAKAINTSFNTPINRPNFSSRPSLIAIQANHANLSAQQLSQQAAQQTAIATANAAATNASNKPPALLAKALYAYAGMPENNVMALSADEYLIVLNTEGDWYLCQRTHDKIEGYGQAKFAPRNYLQIVDIDVDEPPPTAPKPVTVTVRPAATYSSNTLKPSQIQAAQQQQQHQQQQHQSQLQQTVAHTYPNIPQQPQPPPQPSTTATTHQSASTPTAAQTAATVRGPPPFRGSVGPSSQPVTLQPMVTTHSPVNANVSKGPPPFNRASVGPLSQPVVISTTPTNGAGALVKGPPPFMGGPPGQNPTATPAAPGTGSKPPPPKPTRCQALFDFKSDDPTLLSFTRNDFFTLSGDNSSSQWWLAVDDKGNQGYVPSNYVKKI